MILILLIQQQEEQAYNKTVNNSRENFKVANKSWRVNDIIDMNQLLMGCGIT